MNKSRSLIPLFFLALSLSYSAVASSAENDTILLTKPAPSAHSIEETIIDVPLKKSTPADIRKKKMPAKEKSYGEKTASKLGNGLFDVVTSVLEIPKTMIKTSETEGILSGLTIGFAKGVANTASQAVSGAVNVATFPVPQEIENPMKAKKSKIENMDMEDEFGAAFSEDQKQN